MKITVIMTTYNDGPILRQSIDSVLGQTYKNLELILVDDGSSDDIENILAGVNDERLKVIHQFNGGLSSARNRGLQHASGDYVCFLDADDIRPAWSFAAIVDSIDESAADVVFCRGVLSEIDNSLVPFYDDFYFEKIKGVAEGAVSRGSKEYENILPYLYLIEPQSANKVVRLDFLKDHNMVFPNGHFFEDSYFHALCIMNARSIGFIHQPLFTYFRRYNRKQITSGTSDMRLDSVSVAAITLETFKQSSHFCSPAARTALMMALFKTLGWCFDSISYHYKYSFLLATKRVVGDLDSLFFNFIFEDDEVKSRSERIVDFIGFVRG